MSFYCHVAAAVLHLLLGAVLVATGALRKGRRSPSSLLFLGAVAATTAWAITGIAAPGTDPAALALGRWLDLARYGFWLAFLLALIGSPAADEGGAPQDAPARRVLVPVVWLALGANAVLLLISIGAPTLEPVERPLFLALLGLPVVGLVLVEQLFRNLGEDARWGAKPLCIGLGALFSFDLYLYSRAVMLLELDADVLSVRAGVQALSVPLLLLACRRQSQTLGKLQVSRKAAFYSASLFVAGAYLLLVSGVGYYVRYFGGEFGPALQVATLSAALLSFVVLVVSGSFRARMRMLLGKHFFRYRYDYREEWLRFTTNLSSGGSPQEAGISIVKGLAGMVESPAGGLWIRSGDAEHFVQAAHWNMAAVPDKEPIGSPTAAFLLATGWIVDVEEYRRHPERYAALTLPAWLSSRAQAWLVVPLALPADLIGFVLLERPRAPVEMNWEVRDLLKTASRQAAGVLALMRATEALLEARKFDAFNRMSAFVVHDLKNIVTQLSLMLSNAQRLAGNAEFQQDMLTTVASSLEKMRQLMLQLREGETPRDGRSGVDLLPIVRRIEASTQARGRTLELHAADHVLARGHEQRIERVLGHVVQNALDATQPSDRVWLRLQRASGQAHVEVGDTGAGMSDEYVRTRLFKPFQTTKPTGMGIGAYESLQYIRELGGQIAVESHLDRGTVMTILLPLFDAHPTSDLQMASAA